MGFLGSWGFRATAVWPVLILLAIQANLAADDRSVTPWRAGWPPSRAVADICYPLFTCELGE
jgi:hypothetical protein